MPNTRMPSINSDVAIGRRMNGSEMFIGNGSRFNDLRLRVGREAEWIAGDQPDAGPSAMRTYAPSVQPVLLAIDDDFLARLEALADNGKAVLDRGDLDRTALDRVRHGLTMT